MAEQPPLKPESFWPSYMMIGLESFDLTYELRKAHRPESEEPGRNWTWRINASVKDQTASGEGRTTLDALRKLAENIVYLLELPRGKHDFTVPLPVNFYELRRMTSTDWNL